MVEMSGNSVYLGQNGIVCVTCIGDQDEVSITETLAQVREAVANERKLLFDASRAGRFPAEARRVMVDSIASVTQGKVALVGSSTLMQALGLFVAARGDAALIRFFDTRRGALGWLNAGQAPEGKKRSIDLQRVRRSLTSVRWLRIREPWLKEMFEVLEAVATGDFSRRIPVSKRKDELALIEAGINLMADDLEQREREAKEYNSKLREERNRLARELHDSMSQLLFSMVLNSEAASTLVTSDPEQAKTRLKSVQAAATTAHQQMRDLLIELRLGPLEAGLSEALNAYVSLFKERVGINAIFHVEGEKKIAVDRERELFRIAQEALNNVAKHSQATSASVELTFSAAFVRLAIEDNGVGFDLEHAKPGGIGLTHMRERAEGLGGMLAIESAPGKGTRIAVEVPREERYG